MKKNFFKKLSFVLALAMIISTITPAAGALAATKAPKLNATKVYLHLDTKSTNEYDFNVSNKVSGWKYKWTSKNADVASVESNGLVTAEGVGTTTVSVAISNKGEAVKTLKATVVVRDNIKTLKITNTPAGDKLAVGVANDFNRSFVTASGSTKKTSGVTRWSVKEEGATITDSGVFTATKAGEYTITANAFQSTAKYTSWLADSTKYASYVTATATYTVKVAASMTSAKQTGLATFEVNFDSAMTDVAKNLTVSALVGTTKVNQLVKEVKLDTTNKVATVTVYVTLSPETTYVVDYKDMAPVQFVAATTKVEDVKSMVFTTTTAVLNNEKHVEVKLLNAAGVNISTPELLGRVSMKSADSTGTYFDTVSHNIRMYVKGATTTITATFHTYKYNTTTGVEEGIIETAGVVTCVEADAVNVTGVNAWTIVNNSTPVFTDVKQTLASDDSNYKLYVELKTLTGDQEAKVNSSQSAEIGKFEFTSSDESILIINKTTGQLYPVKQGTAVVVVKYGDGTTKPTVGAIPITIGAKRVATNFTLSAYEFTLSNLFADSKAVTVSLKDQLGGDFTYGNYTVEKLSGPSTTVAYPNTVIATGTHSGDTLTFTGNGVVEGSYAYKVTLENISRVVNVTVATPSQTTPAYFRLQLSDATVDAKSEAEKVAKNLTFDLFGYAPNGVKTNKVTLGTTFKVAIDAPFNTVTNLDDKDDSNNTGTYNLVTAVSGGAIDKVPTGDYKVTAFQTIAGVDVPVDVQYFKVTNTQLKPVIGEVLTRLYNSTVSSYASTSPSLITAAKECFKITLDGVDYSANVVSVDATGTGDATYIKSMTVRQYIKIGTTTAATAYIDHKVTIESNVTKK